MPFLSRCSGIPLYWVGFLSLACSSMQYFGLTGSVLRDLSGMPFPASQRARILTSVGLTCTSEPHVQGAHDPAPSTYDPSQCALSGGHASQIHQHSSPRKTQIWREGTKHSVLEALGAASVSRDRRCRNAPVKYKKACQSGERQPIQPRNSGLQPMLLESVCVNLDILLLNFMLKVLHTPVTHFSKS